MAKKPVIVPKEGGHIDYIREDSTFLVDGRWDTCAYGMTPYGCDGDWYDCSVKSGREQLRSAYNIWKEKTNHLSFMGVKAYNHILDGKYSRYSVGSTFFNSLKNLSTTSAKPKSISEKRKVIKQKINKAATLKEKVAVLKDSFKGETCYILSCGPSISDYTLDEYKDKLQDKLVELPYKPEDVISDAITLFNKKEIKCH